MVVINTWKLRTINKKITLVDNELHLWRTKVSEHTNNMDHYWHLLTKDEQVHAKAFYFAEDSNRYIVTRAILRKLIAGYLGIFPQDILFQYTKYGKPYLCLNLKNNSQLLKFNLSHSKDAIIYGITKNINIGVDIEFINKDFAIDDLVEQCCSRQEQNTLITLLDEQKYSYFYNLWVVKEALVKAMGLGLSYDLKQIHVNFNKNKLINATNVVNNEKLYWTQNIFLTYNDYCSAFAISKPADKVLFFTYSNIN